MPVSATRHMYVTHTHLAETIASVVERLVIMLMQHVVPALAQLSADASPLNVFRLHPVHDDRDSTRGILS